MRNDRHQSWIAAVAILLATASSTRAQSSDAALGDDALSRGAAAYSAGNRAEAVELLAEAIRRDPRDPRPYYLRALCLARAGRSNAARADLVVAAALESRQPDQYPVAEILRQLPVNDRILLNQFRWHAETEDFARAFDEGQLTLDQRPEPVVRTDAGVLRQQVALPLDRLTQSITLAELADASAQRPAVAFETGSNPFADDLAPQATPENQTAAVEDRPAAAAPVQAEAAAADPFGGTDSNAAGKIPSSKLFGILRRAVTRAAPLPSLDGVRNQLPDLPLPTAGNHPAPGNPPAAGADPFGSDVEPAAFTEEDPFGQAPAAAEDSPAAAGASSPADEASPATDEQPSPTEDQEPAADPAEDPFG